VPSHSLLQRLKERKLVQCALAYLAGAWVLFEVSDAVGGRLGWPDILYHGLLVLLGVGFFITLILAWYHGEQGRQRVSGPELLMVAALLVVAGVALTLVGPRETPLPPLSSGGEDRPAIAVLPFDNFSPDPGDAYFADGMQEQLVSTLSRISALSLRGRTSVMRYRDNPKPLPEIAEELGVTFVLEGSARMAGNQVRLTAQLIDAGRDEHLWSGEYDRELSAANILTVQSEIAQSVASALQAVLTPEEYDRIEAMPTENLEAYTEYLRGRYHWNERTEAQLLTAIEHFERAVALDPEYAMAYAGLADAWGPLPYYSTVVEPMEAVAKAEAAARKALDLDPTLAGPHALLAQLLYHHYYDWEAAEEESRRALELGPENPTVRQWRSTLLMPLGRWEESLEEARRAVALDPFAPVLHVSVGNVLMYRRDFPAAVRQLQNTLDLDPDFSVAWWSLSDTFLWMGRYEEAVDARGRWALLSGRDPANARAVAEAIAHHLQTGDPAELPASAESEYTLYEVARIYAMAGQIERSVDWLERGREQRVTGVAWITLDPAFDALRDHPRFVALVREVGPNL
jgi:TolB-like protein/Tfp pilus assembly protein PilF